MRCRRLDEDTENKGLAARCPGRIHSTGDSGAEMPDPALDFTPPAEWSNLYYQITLKDGTVLPKQRIVLSQQ